MSEGKFAEGDTIGPDSADIIMLVFQVASHSEQFVRNHPIDFGPDIEFERIVTAESFESGRQHRHLGLAADSVVASIESVEGIIQIRIEERSHFLVAHCRIERIFSHHVVVSEVAHHFDIHITDNGQRNIILLIACSRVKRVLIKETFIEIGRIDVLCHCRQSHQSCHRCYISDIYLHHVENS